jgi:hypothetical protein
MVIMLVDGILAAVVTGRREALMMVMEVVLCYVYIDQ